MASVRHLRSGGLDMCFCWVAATDSIRLRRPSVTRPDAAERPKVFPALARRTTRNLDQRPPLLRDRWPLRGLPDKGLSRTCHLRLSACDCRLCRRRERRDMLTIEPNRLEWDAVVPHVLSGSVHGVLLIGVLQPKPDIVRRELEPAHVLRFVHITSLLGGSTI